MGADLSQAEPKAKNQLRKELQSALQAEQLKQILVKSDSIKPQTKEQIQQKLKNSKKYPAHLLEEIKCVGVAEQPKGSNAGDSVTKWNKMMGFNYPVAWCGNFQGVKCDGLTIPQKRSGTAVGYAVKGYAFQLSDVIYGNYIPKPGDWRVKTRKGGHHVDCFVSWDKIKNEGYVIGGNVSDMVTIRKVTLKSMIADGTTHIVDVREKKKI